MRGYIHVMDLAVLRYCEATTQDMLTVNLGMGEGYSVLDMVRAFEAASGRPVAYGNRATHRGIIGLVRTI